MGFRLPTALAAENLFFRKQLALFQERKVRPRSANDSTRWMMATLSRIFPWRNALVNVNHVRKMTPLTSQRWLLTLSNSQEIIVSKRQAGNVRQMLQW